MENNLEKDKIYLTVDYCWDKAIENIANSYIELSIDPSRKDAFQNIARIKNRNLRIKRLDHQLRAIGYYLKFTGQKPTNLHFKFIKALSIYLALETIAEELSVRKQPNSYTFELLTAIIFSATEYLDVEFSLAAILAKDPDAFFNKRAFDMRSNLIFMLKELGRLRSSSFTIEDKVVVLDSLSKLYEKLISDEG